MSCTYNGIEYSEGSIVCQAGRIMKCSGNDWTDTGGNCEEIELTITSAEPHTVPYRIDTSHTILTTDMRVPYDWNKVRILTPCLSFFAVQIGSVGIRNNCAQCHVAVVSWSPNRPHISKYKVSPFSQIVVNVEDQTGQLIGEDPC